VQLRNDALSPSLFVCAFTAFHSLRMRLPRLTRCGGAQVVGTKEVTLFAPQHSAALYPSEGVMNNTSRVDVGADRVDAAGAFRWGGGRVLPRAHAQASRYVGQLFLPFCSQMRSPRVFVLVLRHSVSAGRF
jgi:hypothetical protein